MATEMNYVASKNIFLYAEVLRKNMTLAEKSIWERVSKNQLGLKIRRQHPIWKYIADFYCHKLKLVMEIDGDIHLRPENKVYDINREITLQEFGIEIIRFTNDQVLKEPDIVIQEIKSKIETLQLKTVAKAKSMNLSSISLAPKSPKGDLGKVLNKG
jgi:very-short-patch-repair endonuclease